MRLFSIYIHWHNIIMYHSYSQVSNSTAHPNGILLLFDLLEHIILHMSHHPTEARRLSLEELWSASPVAAAPIISLHNPDPVLSNPLLVSFRSVWVPSLEVVSVMVVVMDVAVVLVLVHTTGFPLSRSWYPSPQGRLPTVKPLVSASQISSRPLGQSGCLSHSFPSPTHRLRSRQEKPPGQQDFSSLASVQSGTPSHSLDWGMQRFPQENWSQLQVTRSGPGTQILNRK